MAKDYSDKEFKEIYQEVLDYVKTVSTKWDPSVSDESDPGVAILKAFALFIDKIKYQINYRNSQNSVDNVTDKIEGQRLFNQLGYQVKKKRSATGEISVKYIGTDSGTGPLVLNLFTTFSNQTGSQVYTSVRSLTQIPVGDTRVIKVQEGTPLRYKYEGVERFNSDNLTNNLRLPIMGIEEVSDNGVIISSYNTDGTVGIVSDWLNIGDNFFNSVETKNLYSVGTDSDGVPYVQFYEESLPGLANGVGIWIISSAGAAGNIGQNKINRITSEIQDGGDPTAVSITHPEFTNGSDEESLESARNHYYETFGVNESLVSERDYATALSGILGPDLKILTSMVLVTGVDGLHNIVKILSRIDTNKRVILTKFIGEELIPWIFVNALKYTNDYYSSFDSLISEEDEKLIRKALFEKKVVSNETALVGKVKEDGTQAYNSTIYDKYLFDIVSPVGTVVVDTTDSIDQIKDEIVEIISNNFNSRNLEAGKMISESELAEAIRNELSGAIDASFYYSNHRISKKANSSAAGDQLTTEEKRDIIARSVLAGETPLFKDEIIKIPPGATNIKHFPSKASSGGGSETEVDTSKRIVKITGTPSFSSFSGGVQGRALLSNEFIQFYSVAQEEGAIYGSGVQYRLLANQRVLNTQTTITSTTTLKKGSTITSGSQVYSPTLDPDSINSSDPEGGVVTETATADLFTFNKNYTVQNELVIETSGTDSYLQSSTIISDGSILNGEKVYGATIQDGVEFDLGLNNASLVLQPETSTASIITLSSGVIKVSGFPSGLNSSGPNYSGIGESPTFLTSGQTITKMVESSTTISSKFYYGLILPSKTNITLTADKPYVLEEGEHLIYSDENLLDFVDFGSGTLLSISGEGKLDLDNVITYEDDINTSLQKIPQNRDIKISNTNIYTYSGKDYSLDLPAGFISSAEWVKVPSTATVTGPDGEKVFDGKFYHREGLIIETGEYNIFTIAKGQALTLEDDQGKTQIIEGTGTTGTLVSVSSPVYVNSSDNNLESNSNLQVSFYEFSQSTSNVTSNILYTIDGGFTIEVGYLANNGYATFNLNDFGYLLEVQAEIAPESEVEITGASTNPEVNGIKILNSSQNNTIISGPGTYQIFIYPNNTTSITFKFTKGTTGDKITIKTFRQIAGLNPDLDYVSEDGSQNYQPSTEFVFTNSTDEGVQLFNQINSYINSNVDGIVPLDFFYETESPLKNPTEAYKYYDTEHPLNRNIITVINLEDLRNNLKIVRRYRNDRS